MDRESRLKCRLAPGVFAVILTVGAVGGLLPANVEAAAGPEANVGVVLEELSEGSALAKAGVRAGDVVLAWQRLAHPPANPDVARGEITSVFDWLWLVAEQAPRGVVELSGERDGERVTFAVAMGLWDAKARPRMPEEMLGDYLKGKKLIEEEAFEEGIDFWRNATAIAQHVADWRLRCWMYLTIGKAWDEARRWEESRRAYEEALAQARNAESRTVLWHVIGKSNEKQNDLESAETSYLAMLELATAAWGESLVLTQSRSLLGQVAYRRGDLSLSEQHWRDALKIREKLAPESLAVANMLNNLGIAAFRHGELKAARAYHRRALEIKNELASDTLTVAMTLNNLGIAVDALGELDVAEEYHQRALEIKEALAPDSLTMAYNLQGLGSVAFKRGHLDVAMGHYRRALEIREKLAPDSTAMAADLVNVGLVSYIRGELVVAKEHYRRALEIFENVAPNDVNVSYNLINLGNIDFTRGALEDSVEYYRRALEIVEQRAPESLEAAHILNKFGSVARARGDLGAAKEYHRRALEIQEKTSGNSLNAAYSLASLGKVVLDEGRPDSSKEHLERALEIYGNLAPGSYQEAETLHVLGKVFREMGLRNLAAEHFDRSIVALETHIGNLGGSQDVKGRFRARNRELYRHAIRLQLNLEQPEKAFHLLERSRGQSFLALLTERDLVFSADSVPMELETARRRLTVRYERAQQRIAGLNPVEDSREIETLVNEQAILRQERGEITAEIRRLSPRLATVRYPRALTFEQTREALDPGTVMLSYSVGEKQTDLFVSTPSEDLFVKTLPIGEEALWREIVDLRNLIREAVPGSRLGARRMASFENVSKRIYRMLILPVEDRIGNHERILILPDGPLHVLPWSTLIRETVGNGEYLIEWKPLHVALSATVYAELKRHRRKAGETAAGSAPSTLLAAFGDPRYPQATRRADEIADVRVRSAVERGFEFDPLPATRIEVERIAELYPAGVRTYLGAGATEERAKSIDREVRYVHFAVHGTLDERFPLDSALVLTLPGKLTENRDNGLLQVWEIFERMRLDADLVVLSACGSALGEEQGGEGLIGLTRAFQYAGARSVVASLWNVADVSTAELMVRFYRHLGDGKPKDEALRAAQVELIRGPIRVPDEEGQTVAMDASAPVFWGAFQVFGDWR